MAPPELEVTLLVSPSYACASLGSTIIDGFQRMWKEGLLCDTELIVQGQTFRVHRSYLAACSQYFYTMFTSEFNEKCLNQVEIASVHVRFGYIIHSLGMVQPLAWSTGYSATCYQGGG